MGIHLGLPPDRITKSTAPVGRRKHNLTFHFREKKEGDGT